MPRLLLLLLAPALLLAQAPESEPKVVCQASASIAERQSPIGLSAVARAAAGHPLTYTWSPDSGTVAPAAGGDAIWTNPEIGDQSAEVTVTDGNTAIGTCTVRVIIVQTLADAGRGEGQRSNVGLFLYNPDPEPDGVGLYSYIVFGEKNDRNLPILKAILAKAPALAASAQEAARRKDLQDYTLNLIPLTAGAPMTPESGQDAAAVLLRYDFARVKTDWMKKLPVNGDTGTYLVASKISLSKRKPGDEIVVFDLSDPTLVSANLVGVWVDKFVNQAIQTNWSAKNATMTQFLLKTRLNLEIYTNEASKVAAVVKLFSK